MDLKKRISPPILMKVKTLMGIWTGKAFVHVLHRLFTVLPFCDCVSYRDEGPSSLPPFLGVVNTSIATSSSSMGTNVIVAQDTKWENLGPIMTETQHSYTRRANIKWRQSEHVDAASRTPLDYFYHTFPRDQWQVIVRNTNSQMEDYHLVDALTESELQRYIGIRLAMALEYQHGRVEDFWNTEQGSGFMQPRNYEQRTGMTLTRFKNISRSFRLHDYHQASVAFHLYYLLETIFC